MRFLLPKLAGPAAFPFTRRCPVLRRTLKESGFGSFFRLSPWTALRASSFNILAGRFLLLPLLLQASVTASPRWQ
jgi:hypothetical protein